VTRSHWRTSYAKSTAAPRTPRRPTSSRLASTRTRTGGLRPVRSSSAPSQPAASSSRCSARTTRLALSSAPSAHRCSPRSSPTPRTSTSAPYRSSTSGPLTSCGSFVRDTSASSPTCSPAQFNPPTPLPYATCSSTTSTRFTRPPR